MNSSFFLILSLSLFFSLFPRSLVFFILFYLERDLSTCGWGYSSFIYLDKVQFHPVPRENPPDHKYHHSHTNNFTGQKKGTERKRREAKKKKRTWMKRNLGWSLVILRFSILLVSFFSIFFFLLFLLRPRISLRSAFSPKFSSSPKTSAQSRPSTVSWLPSLASLSWWSSDNYYLNWFGFSHSSRNSRWVIKTCITIILRVPLGLRDINNPYTVNLLDSLTPTVRCQPICMSRIRCVTSPLASNAWTRPCRTITDMISPARRLGTPTGLPMHKRSEEFARLPPVWSQMPVDVQAFPRYVSSHVTMTSPIFMRGREKKKRRKY